MRWKRGLRRILFYLRNFGIFLLFTCFIVSCSILLFSAQIRETMDFTYTKENLTKAASLTFANILFLSLMFTIVDAIRREITVKRPVKRIVKAANQVMQGDFSVQIEKFRTMEAEESYDVVIDYFNRMTKELSGMETLRTDFVANVSHELKTPLSVMQNYGTLLQQQNLSEELRIEYAKTIIDASRNMASMVTNILKLNKLENQNIYPTMQTYNLSEQLCECLLSFENVWESKNLEMQTDLEEDVLIYADPELLALVWNNLFSNAMKFTQPGGMVTLTLKATEDTAEICVSDTGCGISPKVGKHIFEKFYQGDTSHATKGNGLGLALVKRVVDIIGGEIHVESEVGKGSTFTIKLRRESK